MGELIGVVSIEAVINCNEVDACMSAASGRLGMAVAHKCDCHSVTALPDPEAILEGSKELMSLLSGM